MVHPNSRDIFSDGIKNLNPQIKENLSNRKVATAVIIDLVNQKAGLALADENAWDTLVAQKDDQSVMRMRFKDIQQDREMAVSLMSVGESTLIVSATWENNAQEKTATVTLSTDIPPIRPDEPEINHDAVQKIIDLVHRNIVTKFLDDSLPTQQQEIRYVSNDRPRGPEDTGDNGTILRETGYISHRSRIPTVGSDDLGPQLLGRTPMPGYPSYNGSIVGPDHPLFHRGESNNNNDDYPDLLGGPRWDPTATDPNANIPILPRANPDSDLFGDPPSSHPPGARWDPPAPHDRNIRRPSRRHPDIDFSPPGGNMFM